MALRVSAVVARNELFERYGERPVQPPLEPGSWAGSSEEAESESEQEDSDDDDGEPKYVVSALEALESVLSNGPMIVHHWATWCESCISEMDAVRSVSRDAAVPMIGVSWDPFEGQNAADCLKDVRAVAKEHGLRIDQYVLDAEPETVFDKLNMKFKQVPQTWLVDDSGTVVLRVEGILDDQSIAGLIDQAAGL